MKIIIQNRFKQFFRKAMMFTISVIAFGGLTGVVNMNQASALTGNEMKVFSQYLKTGQSVNDIMRRDVIESGNIGDTCFYLKLPTTIQTKSLLNMITVVNKDLTPVECEPYLCYYRDRNTTIELDKIPRDAEFIGDTIRVIARGDIPLGDLYVVVNFDNCHYVNGQGTVQQQAVIGKYCMLHFTCIDNNKTVNNPPMYAFNFMPSMNMLDGRKHSSVDTTKGVDLKPSGGTYTKDTPKPEITIESKPKVEKVDKNKAKSDVTAYIKPSKSIVQDKIPVNESFSYITKPILNTSKRDLQYVAVIMVIMAIFAYQLKLREK